MKELWKNLFKESQEMFDTKNPRLKESKSNFNKNKPLMQIKYLVIKSAVEFRSKSLLTGCHNKGINLLS